MMTAAGTSAAAPPLAVGIASALQAFARACRAATRAIGLYPGEHPTVGSTLSHLVTTAGLAAGGRELTVTVLVDTLAIDGRRPARPDPAVTELAVLLHAHQVAAVTLQPQVAPDEWRRFLGLLAIPPDQLRRRGGLAQLWSSEGQTGIQVRKLDYHVLLRERIQGERATWESAVELSLRGDAALCNDAIASLVLELLDRPEDSERLLTAIGEALPADTGTAALVVGGVLHAVLAFVQRTNPDHMDPLLTAAADVATHLPIETLAAFSSNRAADQARAGHSVVARLARHMSDDALASRVVEALQGAAGSSDALDTMVTGFLPDIDRRSAVLALARHMLEHSEGTAAPADVKAHLERLLSRLDERRFVGDTYSTELHRAAARAVELDRHDADPADVVDAWRGTVADDRLQMLDAVLLIDLMHLRRDTDGWRESADLAVARIVALMTAGDFSPAAFLVEALRLQEEDHPSADVRSAAGQTLNGLLRGDLLRSVAMHLDTSDVAVVAAVKRLCHALGTGVTVHLAEALAGEDRPRVRQHLVTILSSFGAAGRQAIERLMHAPSAAARRTAILLLRESGDESILPRLEAMLADREPHVQREASRAVILLGAPAAYEALVRTLVGGDADSRAAVTSVLWSMPIEDTAPVLAHFVATAPVERGLADIHERALQRLGGASGSAVVSALRTAMERRHARAPFRTAALRRRAAEALARIGTEDARTCLRAAAVGGSWGMRRAARTALSAIKEPPT